MNVKEFNSDSSIAIMHDFENTKFYKKKQRDCVCVVCGKPAGKDDVMFVIKQRGGGLFSSSIDFNTFLHFECIVKSVKEQNSKFYAKLVAKLLEVD